MSPQAWLRTVNVCRIKVHGECGIRRKRLWPEIRNVFSLSNCHFFFFSFFPKINSKLKNNACLQGETDPVPSKTPTRGSASQQLPAGPRDNPTVGKWTDTVNPRGKIERRRNQPWNPRSLEPLRVPVLSLRRPDQAGPGTLPSRAARTRPAPGAICRGREAICTARSAGNLGLKTRDWEAGNESRGKRTPMGATPPF